MNNSEYPSRNHSPLNTNLRVLRDIKTSRTHRASSQNHGLKASFRQDPAQVFTGAYLYAEGLNSLSFSSGSCRDHPLDSGLNLLPSR